MDINSLIIRLQELENLLSSYEVMIDKVYYNHLLNEYNSVNSIIEAFNDGNTVLAEKLLLKHKKLGQETIAIEGAGDELVNMMLEYGLSICHCTEAAKRPAKQSKIIVSGIGVSEVLKKHDGIMFYPYQTGEFEFDLKDVRIDVFHASGAGGQNVNKVETAIRAVHLPSGVSVVCQDERSQGRNRDMAVERLKTKVSEHYKKEAEKQNKTERSRAVKN